jgi:hypothetical protein
MAIRIHRRPQFDLEVNPIVCVHLDEPNRSKRVFCLWRWGVEAGPVMVTRRGITSHARVITGAQIGKLRRALFLPGRWKWNAWVRDATALLG